MLLKYVAEKYLMAEIGVRVVEAEFHSIVGPEGVWEWEKKLFISLCLLPSSLDNGCFEAPLPLALAVFVAKLVGGVWALFLVCLLGSVEILKNCHFSCRYADTCTHGEAFHREVQTRFYCLWHIGLTRDFVLRSSGSRYTFGRELHDRCQVAWLKVTRPLDLTLTVGKYEGLLIFDCPFHLYFYINITVMCTKHQRRINGLSLGAPVAAPVEYWLTPWP